MRSPSITLVVTLAVLLTRGHCTNCDFTCAPSDAVHIIVSRGSTESPGMGTMGLTANQTVAKIPGSDAVGLDYPAIYPPIKPSEPEGVAALTQYVTEYIDACPDSNVVLMGYSQGAMVTMDTLCGTSSAGFAATSAIDSKYAKNIAAVVLYGDPSWVFGESWNRGNATNVSYFPRKDNDACAPFAKKIGSWCDNDDYFCDNGTSIAVHTSYPKAHGDQAVQFVLDTISGGSKA